jgi:cadmium resistance protein CadD (predicted permease)
MEYYLPFIGIAIGLFVTTNIDDVFILLGFFSDSKFKFRQIALGQYAGITVLYGVSVVGSLISLVISPAYIGLLGLVPIFLGAKKVWELRGGTEASDDELEGHSETSLGHGNIIAVAAVTVANGADNISIYTPLFATRSGYDIVIIGAVFAIMTMVWITAAYWLTNHRSIGAPIRRYGHKLVPIVLIALGFLILYESGSVELFHQD